MRGIVFTGEVEVRDDISFRRPLAPSQLRVRIVNAGLCHSDVSVIDGTIPYPTPVVMGHEGAGIVEEVGEQVAHVEPGDHVVLTTLTSCGACAACAAGRPVLCKQSNRLARRYMVGEEKAYDFANTSVWAEEAVVEAVQAVKIPTDVPLTAACLVGCGVLTGVGAVLNRARVEVGQTAVVIGVGGIGLSAVQGCRLAGAGRIVAVDTNPAKEDLALRMGATDFVDSSEGDMEELVQELLPDGADHVFECVGRPELVAASTRLLDWGGQAVLLGVPKMGTEAGFVVSDLYHDKSILGCRYGSARPQHDIPMLIELYRQGRLYLDELVTATYPLDEIDRALAELHSGALARGVLEISAG